MNRKLKILIFSIFLIGFLGALTYADIIPVDDYDFMWEYSLFNVTNITVDKITAKDWGNWSGRLGQIENSYDTNASDCEDEDYLDGDTTCKNFNNTVLDITKSTSYNATTIETLEGTYDTGDIDSILIARDGDSYNVSEDAGASPLLIEVNFSGVDDFNSIVMRLLYIGGVGHEVEICLWDYTLADWECEYGEITDMEIFAFSNTNVLDATDHINVTEGGKVILRFDHVQSGIGTHDFALDFISLVDGFATITTPKHNSLSGRDDTSNHPWALAADGSRIGENITIDNFNTTGNVNLSDVLYIDADGEVGIGTLNPNGLFEIAGKIFIEDWSNATDLDAAGDVADDSHDHSSVGSTVTIAAADIVDTDAGTDITADLEEEVTEGSLADSTIISADIKDDVIVEADLNAIDAAGDEECLTFEGDTSNFEWQTCGAGGVGGGTGLPIWIDGTTSLYINKTYSELLNVSAVNTTSVNTTDLLVTNYIEGKGTADFKILQSSDWTNGTFTRSQITNAYDTNASTECATEEVLLGNASCMDIEGNEWINPGEIADVDDADIETDLNTYIDVGGDTCAAFKAFDWNKGNLTNAHLLQSIFVNASMVTATILNATGDIYLGVAEADHSIYFFEDGSATGEFFKWDDGDDRFEFSDDVFIDDDLYVDDVTGSTITAANGHLIGDHDIYTSGVGDDLWLGTSTQAKSNFQAFADGNVWAEGLNSTIKNLTIQEGFYPSAQGMTIPMPGVTTWGTAFNVMNLPTSGVFFNRSGAATGQIDFLSAGDVMMSVAVFGGSAGDVYIKGDLKIDGLNGANADFVCVTGEGVLYAQTNPCNVE